MGHNHGHHHASANYGRAFAFGIALNLGFVIVEFIYGRLAGSLALAAASLIVMPMLTREKKDWTMHQ